MERFLQVVLCPECAFYRVTRPSACGVSRQAGVGVACACAKSPDMRVWGYQETDPDKYKRLCITEEEVKGMPPPTPLLAFSHHTCPRLAAERVQRSCRKAAAWEVEGKGKGQQCPAVPDG
eukprot:1147859-Rhodomonas_salina.1